MDKTLIIVMETFILKNNIYSQIKILRYGKI